MADRPDPTLPNEGDDRGYDADTDDDLAGGAYPDPMALRRRVLLTGIVSLLLFFVLAYLVASAGVSDWWLLIAMVVAYIVVIRPLMRPVRAASSLRRRLAYQAFLDSRENPDP